MAFLTCTFTSSILQRSVHFNAIIPPGQEQDARVLYLLHGLGQDHTAWQRFTSIERYANENGIAVIMPDGGRSFYTDMVYGEPYYSFFVEELFDYIPNLFSVSKKRENTFIAGLSMGGYGALKIALRNPEKFAAAASLSGAVDVCDRLYRDPRWMEIKKLVFGGNTHLAGTSDDLFHLIKQYTYENPIRLYIACGTEDFLYQNNLSFVNALSQTNLPYHFASAPGIHEWKFWDIYIQKAIHFLLKK